METRVVKITDGEIIGIETREIRAPVSELENYLLEKGFKHDGVWYLRKSWMNESHFRLFEAAGLVELIGTYDDLRNTGVELPGTYNGKAANAVFYRVINDKINQLEPKN